MNLGEPASFDGRYFGPLPASSIVGGVALWHLTFIARLVGGARARGSVS